MPPAHRHRQAAPRAHARAGRAGPRPRQPEPARRRRDRARRRGARRGLAHRLRRRPTRRSRRCARPPAPSSPTRPYVSLEPCCHTGKQPPCTDAIVAAGIRRVVVASDDPTEKASGRGLGILRDEGVEVVRRRRRAGRPRAPAQPAVPQARAHRPAVGPVQVGDDARRQGRHARRRLEVDLLRGEPPPRAPLARRVRRGRRRDRHRARRRPAADRAHRGRRAPAAPRRVRLDSRACRSTPSSSRGAARSR